MTTHLSGDVLAEELYIIKTKKIMTSYGQYVVWIVNVRHENYSQPSFIIIFINYDIDSSEI